MKKKRKNFFLRRFASICRKFLVYYNEFSYDFYKNGEYELLKELSQFDFKIIFDVGSNVGDWASIAEKFFPNASIHTFELSKSTFETISRKLTTENFVLNNVGLSDKSSTINYKDYGVNSGVNTILLEATYHDKCHPFKLVEGQIITGDSYCAEKNISHIDFLKIDVEGAEHLVLKGFDNLLKRKSIRIIQFEYGYTNGDAKFLMRDFYSLLESYGYVVGKIRKQQIIFSEWTYKDNDFDSGPNYVAIRKDDQELILALTNYT